MKIELKEQEGSHGMDYDITVTANPKNIEKVFDSLEEFKEDNLDDDDDFSVFSIAEYIDQQGKFNIVHYYESYINEFLDFDDAVMYAGILTSFEKDGDKLFLSIKNAEMAYNEDQVKLFFFGDIVDTEEDKIAAIQKLESEIQELEHKIEILKKGKKK